MYSISTVGSGDPKQQGSRQNTRCRVAISSQRYAGVLHEEALEVKLMEDRTARALMKCRACVGSDISHDRSGCNRSHELSFYLSSHISDIG